MSTKGADPIPKASASQARKGVGRRSESAENYLLSLRILQEDGIAPHISQLAEFLRHIPAEEGIGTTLASVSGMVHRMSTEGLISVNSEKRILLTDEGQLLAHDVVRRHRLSERLLVNILDVPLERAETEAHRLEHSISPDLLRRIEAKLDYPETCPYGRSIEREDEIGPRPEPPEVMPLSDATSGADYTVVRIPDEAYPLLRYLVENKVLPGQRVRIAEIAPYRGVVDLERDGEGVSISIEVASRIRVRPADS
jgi:DtxR family Mn-dependent transcriptional regulator